MSGTAEILFLKNPNDKSGFDEAIDVDDIRILFNKVDEAILIMKEVADWGAL